MMFWGKLIPDFANLHAKVVFYYEICKHFVKKIRKLQKKCKISDDLLAFFCFYNVIPTVPFMFHWKTLKDVPLK